jgi:myo-inositol-1(or 4)-monophosphatase
MQKDQATLLKAKDAVVAAFKALRPKLLESYGNVENSYKSDKTVVTELDLWVEQEIKTALRTFDSAIGFLGEEHGAEGSTTLRWIIDPIDGTEQFIRGIPICSNMATLADGTDLLVTVIYNFVTDELYWAVKGGGNGLDDKRLNRRLRDIGAEQLLEAANRAGAFYARGGAKVWADGMLNACNKGLHNKFAIGADEP